MRIKVINFLISIIIKLLIRDYLLSYHTCAFVAKRRNINTKEIINKKIFSVLYYF